MLSVSEAQSIILDHTRTPIGDVEALTSALLGHILAEPVMADLDSTPFDKSMMDGFAIRSLDCSHDQTSLQIIGEVSAGSATLPTLDAHTAVRIMTGAPIPHGADAVIMKERASDSGDVVMVDPVEAGTNILRRGSEMKAGQVVLDVGTRLRAAEFGLLAAVGRGQDAGQLFVDWVNRDAVAACADRPHSARRARRRALVLADALSEHPLGT